MWHESAVREGFNPYSDSPDTAGLFSSIAHAVSGAAKGIAKGAKSVGNAAVKVASVPAGAAAKLAKATHIPGANLLVNAVLPGITATKLGGQVIQSTINSVVNPNIKNLVNSAQLALKNAGPLGMVASGALGAMQAGLQGKNLEEIAWAAAEGAAPSGIDAAIKAAHQLRGGANVLTTALNAAATSFVPGSPEKFGFDIGIKTLKEAASKAALGVARKALPSEGARRAFDVAVGVVSKGGLPNLPDVVKAAKGLNPAAVIALAKKNLPTKLIGVANPMRSPVFVRPGSLPIVSLGRKAVSISAVPSATKAVVDALKHNPSLIGSSRQLLAQNMRTNSATVNDAMAIVSRGKNLLPWRSMAPHTVAFIRKYVPNAPLTALRHAHTDVGGLDASGTTYIVEKGDGPWAIAQKLSGNGNNWKMLLDYNKDKKPTVDKNIWVGEVLNLPPSWQKPVQVLKPTTALPSVPPPTIAPLPNPVTQVTTAATSVVPSILQAKAILAAWGKTDGINQSGLPDYGLNPADMSTSMGPRDTMMLQSFQVWDNKTLNDGLPVDGNLDSNTLIALQSWAANRAVAASPSATPIVGSPGIMQTIPTVIGGTDSVLPTVTVTPKPATTATPVVASASKSATGGSGAAIAIGAVVGGLLFGVPGALIGAASGAAVS